MSDPKSQPNTLPVGPLPPDTTVLQFPHPEVPGYLRRAAPLVSMNFIVDADVPVMQLARALASEGLYIINTNDGRLCVTHRPWEWRP